MRRTADVLPSLLASLRSRDYLVRCITANALGENIRRHTGRHAVVPALRAALRSSWRCGI